MRDVNELLDKYVQFGYGERNLGTGEFFRDEIIRDLLSTKDTQALARDIRIVINNGREIIDKIREDNIKLQELIDILNNYSKIKSILEKSNN